MISLRTAIFALWGGVCIAPFFASAHDLKDGVVERDVQLVVFPDRVEIQYTIEMNSRTRDEHLKKHINQSQSSAKSDVGNSSDEAARGVEVSSDRSEWDGYRKSLVSALDDGFSLTINSEKREVELVSSETVEKHSTKLHFVLAAKVRVGSKVQSLLFQDKNFADYAGYHRMAIKGRRGVLIQDANVPYIVSKVKRVDTAELSEQEKQNASVVTARISKND